MSSGFPYNPPTNVDAIWQSGINKALVTWVKPVPLNGRTPTVLFIYVDGNPVSQGIPVTQVSSSIGLSTTYTGNSNTYPFRAGITYTVTMKSGYRQSTNNNAVIASDFSNSASFRIDKNAKFTLTAPDGQTLQGVLTEPDILILVDGLSADPQFTANNINAVTTDDPTTTTIDAVVNWWLQHRLPDPLKCPVGQHLENGFCVPDIIPVPPLAPTLSISGTGTNSPLLSWSDVGTNIYDVEESNPSVPTFTSAFGFGSFQKVGNVYQLLVGVNSGDGLYQWRVRAQNQFGNSPYSNTVQLTHTTGGGTGGTNHVVQISTKCGNLRAVFNESNFIAWKEINSTSQLCNLPILEGSDVPCSLSYTDTGALVSEADNSGFIFTSIKNCYMGIPPPPSDTGKFSLIGLTMGLLALLFIGDRKRKKRAH